MVKKKIKLIISIIIQIITPIIVIIIPLLCPGFIRNMIINIYETLFGNEWKITTYQKITASIMIWLGIFILNRQVFKTEFLKGDVYGSKHIIWYGLAKILGYNKISLIRKPYNIIFKIVKYKMFEIVPDEIEEDDVEAYVDYSNIMDSNNLRECNLIIADTYEIKKEQIPESKRNLDTIYVYRDKSEKVNNRIYSPKLLSKIGEAFERAQKTGGKINLFLTTNTRTTKEMIEKILMKGERSTYNIEIFLQEDSGIRMFNKKGIKV